MTTLKPGDEVRVFSSNRYREHPRGGWVATVSKVGRKYATATFDRPWTQGISSGVAHHAVVFNMATGGVKEDMPYCVASTVKTPAQLAEDERRESALSSLKAFGLVPEHSYDAHMLSVECLEALASVAEQFKTSTEGEQSNG